jgi:hypothetical protein
MNNASRLSFVYLILFMISTVIGIINPKHAIAQEFSGPIASSTGGAGRGSALGPDAHFLNPAGLSFIEGFFGSYLNRSESFQNYDAINDWAVQLTDAHEGALVPAAFSYISTDRITSGRRFSETNYQLSMATRIIQRWSVGAVGRRWDETNAGGVTEEIWQLGVGVLGYPLDGFSVGFTANNMLDEHTSRIRPELGLGSEVFFEDIFRVRVDGIYPTKFNPRKKGILAAGVETIFDNGMRVRMGSQWDDVENNAKWTAGVGWEGPRISLQYAFEHDYRVDRYRQSFDLRAGF